MMVAAVGLGVSAIALLFVLVWLLGIERRVTTIESKLTHLPTHGDLQGIRNDIADVASEVAAMRAQSEGTARNVQMIHKHLLEGE